MAMNINVPAPKELRPRIVVLGKIRRCDEQFRAGLGGNGRRPVDRTQR